MTGGYIMKEKNIQELAKRMGLITVENMCQYTIAQLVVMVANKVNELVDEVWRFETDVQEILKTQNENIQYLLGEGLHLEVATVFEGWMEDGTFDTLINQTALKKVNDRIDETNKKVNERIDETNTQLSDVEYLIDDINENTIKNIPGMYNSLKLKKGEYRISSIEIDKKCVIDLNGSTLIMTNKDKNLFVSNGFSFHLKNGKIKTDYLSQDIYRYSGLGVYAHGDNIVIDNIEFIGCGLIVYSSNHTLIKNCLFNGESNNVQYGISMLNCTNFTLENNYISNFSIDGIKTGSINADKSPTGKLEKNQYGCIRGNFIYNCTDDGIDIYDGGRKIIVSENTIIRCGKGLNIKSQNATGAIAETNKWAEESIICNNVIDECNQFMQLGGSNYTVTGNRMRKHRDSSNSLNGVTIGTDNLYPEVKNIIFSDNVIYGADNYGLFVGTYASNVLISNIHIWNTGSYSMNLESGCQVNGGILIDCGGDRYINLNSKTSDKTFVISNVKMENINENTQYGIRSSIDNEYVSVNSCITKNIATSIRDESATLSQANNSWLGRMYGETSQRPNRSTYDRGTTYFDRTLRKLLTWDGTDWRDASGVAV